MPSNRFVKHIPRFIDTDRKSEDTFEFETAEELLSELMKRKTYGSPTSLDDLRYNDKLILWVSEDGSKWWVLGRVDSQVEGIKQWIKGER